MVYTYRGYEIRLDNEVIDAFRRAENEGSGYQTMINKALRDRMTITHVEADEELGFPLAYLGH